MRLRKLSSQFIFVLLQTLTHKNHVITKKKFEVVLKIGILIMAYIMGGVLHFYKGLILSYTFSGSSLEGNILYSFLTVLYSYRKFRVKKTFPFHIGLLRIRYFYTIEQLLNVIYNFYGFSGYAVTVKAPLVKVETS
jgi:hypothetical protein